jgi:hypothetical protein
MKLLITVALLGTSLNTLANDGGMAAIKVSEIKMREYEFKPNEGEVEKKRITHPNFKIFINGEEARKLQAILPPSVSVVTSMNPKIKDIYNETFKSLGIYSDASPGVTAKVISISCDDGELSSDANGQPTVVKKAQSECTITINAFAGEPGDWFGDVQPFDPKMCK